MVRLTMEEDEYNAFLRAIASYAETRSTTTNDARVALDVRVSKIFANEPVLRDAYFNMTSP